eukprot:15474784-Alexandrium_andersonii.AAC.1
MLTAEFADPAEGARVSRPAGCESIEATASDSPRGQLPVRRAFFRGVMAQRVPAPFTAVLPGRLGRQTE